jgi:hypothetical protein
MKSANPNSGFHEETIAKALDTSPDPTCNQGGNVIVQPTTVPDVVYCLEGNTVDRNSSKNGKGFCEKVSPTLDTQDRHAVCFQQNQRDEVRSMGQQTGALTSEAGMHNQNYVCYPDKARSLCARGDSSPCVDRGQNIVCYEGQNISTDSDKAFTLQAGRPDDHHIPAIATFAPEGNHCGAYREDDVSATLQTGYHYGGGGDGAIAVYDCRGNGDGRTVQTLTGDHNNRVTDYTTICCQNIVKKAEDDDE